MRATDHREDTHLKRQTLNQLVIKGDTYVFRCKSQNEEKE